VILKIMTAQEKLIYSIGSALTGAEKSQMFGKPCFKIKGKAFNCFFQEELVLKLSGEVHTEALSLDGSQLFDPSGKKRAMKEWVQLSFDFKEKWSYYAKKAFDHVNSNS
jgi:hypothetical protein